jgi:hypothetical protein
LRAVGEDKLRRIAGLALERNTNAEIEARIGNSVATVEWKLRHVCDSSAMRGGVGTTARF